MHDGARNTIMARLTLRPQADSVPWHNDIWVNNTQVNSPEDLEQVNGLAANPITRGSWFVVRRTHLHLSLIHI